MPIPNIVKCPICEEKMVLADPRVALAIPFVMIDPKTGNKIPPDESTVRICLQCGNVQQFILIHGVISNPS